MYFFICTFYLYYYILHYWHWIATRLRNSFYKNYILDRINKKSRLSLFLRSLATKRLNVRFENLVPGWVVVRGQSIHSYFHTKPFNFPTEPLIFCRTRVPLPTPRLRSLPRFHWSWPSFPFRAEKLCKPLQYKYVCARLDRKFTQDRACNFGHWHPQKKTLN